MGKACLILAAMLVALYLFPPESLVHGATLESPLAKEKPGPDTGVIDNGGLDYDYAFLNEPSFIFGGFPRRLSKSGGRHKRLMKRLKRYAFPDKKNKVPEKKIPPGCCSCGDHYCCDGMCHGK